MLFNVCNTSNSERKIHGHALRFLIPFQPSLFPQPYSLRVAVPSRQGETEAREH